MMLKDLMEEKKLNFNQPLLSVRRFSSTMASETDCKSKTDNSFLPSPPAYKSDLKSVPVRNAGTVPFVWEKVPGRPKDESKLQAQAVEEPPIVTPNFPPGRASHVKQQSLAEMRTGSTLSNSLRVTSLDKRVTKYSKEETKENGDSDSDDGDEAYKDALDTLSRTDLCFMSCSVNGLSGWDDQEFQPYGSFSSNRQQALDFMIDRFLPAAKAMISEAPKYSSKKALVGKAQQKLKNKELNKEISCSHNQNRPKALPHYSQDVDREESEDERDDCNENENYTATTCGRFPRFCLMNPIHGLRMMDKVKRNAAHGMQATSAASHIETTKEQAITPYGKMLVYSQSCYADEKETLDILVKSTHGNDLRRRGYSKFVSCERTQHDPSDKSHVVEKTLHIDSVHKAKSQTNNIGRDFETLRRDIGIYNNPSIDSGMQGLTVTQNQGRNSYQDLVVTSIPKVVECKKTNSESQVYSRERNSKILTQNSELGLKSQLAAKWFDQECILASSKVTHDRKINLESQCLTNLGHQKQYGGSYVPLPPALPSLKAPSESWLKRTLPTISKRNMTSHSKLLADIYALSQIP
ncbi:hypothetical protein Fmac_019205 [Flemingia macrophylla]|uniref:DUF3741 domain-containing protein n=1 Tax=Flemingia macrophylla TaxID=520843 RepID=A0ABD1M761_9FABA